MIQSLLSGSLSNLLIADMLTQCVNILMQMEANIISSNYLMFLRNF